MSQTIKQYGLILRYDAIATLLNDPDLREGYQRRNGIADSYEHGMANKATELGFECWARPAPDDNGMMLVFKTEAMMTGFVLRYGVNGLNGEYDTGD